MQATESKKIGQIGTNPSDLLDRALTIGGYLSAPDGRYKQSTANLYATAWAAFETWCRSAGRTPMPATPETIATYALSLLDEGRVPETIKCRITAIRARHRIMGHPVPDNVPAWTVLSAAESSRVRPVVNGIARTDLLTALRACPETILGTRNRAIALLAWDVLLPVPEIIALDIEDIDDRPEGYLTIRTDPTRDVAHDHTPETTNHERAAEDTYACPACAIQAWVRKLHLSGIRSGALFRPVDRMGVIAEPGIRRSGNSAPDYRLSIRSVHRVWARLVRDSGITPCTPRSIRLGGARARVDRGESPGSVIARAAWSPTSSSVVTRLL
jgi:integrase